MHEIATMRITTLILSILDAAAAIALAVYIFKYIADPMFLGLDMVVAWGVTILGLVTALPALVLALRHQRSKLALALAIAFPVGLAGLMTGVFLYFTYVL